MELKRLYKILVDGKSCHGGKYVWDLPKKVKGNWKPSKWHHIKGKLELCSKGFHVTSNYKSWLLPGCTIYKAEVKELGARGINDKFVCRSVRLLKPIYPWWIHKVNEFIDELSKLDLTQTRNLPKGKYKKFDDVFSAREYLSAHGNALYHNTATIPFDEAWNAVIDGPDSKQYRIVSAVRLTLLAKTEQITSFGCASADLTLAGLYHVFAKRYKLPKKYQRYVAQSYAITKAGYGIVGCIDGVFYVGKLNKD